MIYTAILMSEEGFELTNFQVTDGNPIRYPVFIPSTEYEGHRHPSRPETMVRKDVIFFVDPVETELAQMIYGDHVLIYCTRTPGEIHWDNETESVF